MKKFMLILVLLIISKNSLFCQFEFTPLNTPYVSGKNLLLISIFKSTGGVMYLGTMDDGIFRSFDEGATWEIINSSESKEFVAYPTKFFTNDDKFVIVYSDDVDGQPISFHYSIDSCKNWYCIDAIKTKIDKVQEVYLFSDNNVALLEEYSGKMYLSKDSCKSWNEVSFFSDKRVTDFYHQNEKLYALVNGKELFYSESSELNDWQKFEFSNSADSIIKFAITKDERLVIQNNEYKFFVQEKTNRQLNQIYLGVPEDGREYVFAIEPITNDYWLITYNNYLYDWNTFDMSCYNESTNQSNRVPLFCGGSNFHLCGETLYAVSMCELMKANINTTNHVESDVNDPVEYEFSIMNDNCRISVNNGTNVSYNVYNISGEELLNGTFCGKVYEFSINSLAKGAYFIKITINDKVYIGKFIYKN